jgi:LacI family transcriptional regulator
VPHDISLIGFDDIPLTSVVSPALTTVAQPIQQISKLAFDLLIDRIQQKEGSSADKHIVLPTSLVIRESCRKFGA